MSAEFFTVPDNAPIVGAIYAHYKNLDKEYRVTGISLNSDSDEWHVEYVPLYENPAAEKFNRSLIGWLLPTTVEGKEVTRYPFVRTQL
jgi:hypothetical protein